MVTYWNLWKSEFHMKMWIAHGNHYWHCRFINILAATCQNNNGQKYSNYIIVFEGLHIRRSVILITYNTIGRNSFESNFDEIIQSVEIIWHVARPVFLTLCIFGRMYLYLSFCINRFSFDNSYFGGMILCPKICFFLVVAYFLLIWLSNY